MSFANTEEDQLNLLKNAIHAVRSPASSIWDLADTILATKRETLDEQTRADMDQIRESAQQVLASVDALTMLMRVEILQAPTVAIELTSAIEEAIRRFETSQRPNEQSININLSTGVVVGNSIFEDSR